jgi:hypothetical protein
MPLPYRPLYTQLPFCEVHVYPLQCHHFAAPEPRLTTQENDEKRLVIIPCGFDKPFVVVEIVKHG